MTGNPNSACHMNVIGVTMAGFPISTALIMTGNFDSASHMAVIGITVAGMLVSTALLVADKLVLDKHSYGCTCKDLASPLLTSQIC